MDFIKLEEKIMATQTNAEYMKELRTREDEIIKSLGYDDPASLGREDRKRLLFAWRYGANQGFLSSMLNTERF